MKRKIEIVARHLRITAVIDSSGRVLTRDEVEHIRDVFATKLMYAAAELPYLGVPLSRVRVK